MFGTELLLSKYGRKRGRESVRNIGQRCFSLLSFYIKKKKVIGQIDVVRDINKGHFYLWMVSFI